MILVAVTLELTVRQISQQGLSRTEESRPNKRRKQLAHLAPVQDTRLVYETTRARWSVPEPGLAREKRILHECAVGVRRFFLRAAHHRWPGRPSRRATPALCRPAPCEIFLEGGKERP